MAKQVHWTKRIVEEFEDRAMLSDLECGILETRARGWTITQQADYFHKSKSSINAIVSILKRKYDVVQEEYPEIFPKRFRSINEEFMDNN